MSLAHREGLTQTTEHEAADPGLDTLFLGLGRGAAHACDFRLGEDACGYHVIIHNRIHAHCVLGGAYAFEGSDMGEEDSSHDVTDGINPGHTALKVIVDHDLAALAEFDPDIIQPQIR